jgi:hypothetical protein
MPKTKTMPLKEVLDLLADKNTNLQVLKFRKRTTDQIRLIRFETSLDGRTAGKKAAYDFKAKELVPVWDTDVKEIRSIPTDRIIAYLKEGHWHTVIREDSDGG